MLQASIDTYCPTEVHDEEWDTQGLFNAMDQLVDLALTHRPQDLQGKSRDELSDLLTEAAEQRYAAKEQEIAEVGADIREIERQVTMQIIDGKWIEHLNAMDYLREGIYLRGYAQQDPLVAYKKEAYEMFQALLGSIQDDIVGWMYHIRLVRQAPPPPRRIINPLPVEAEGNGHDLLGGNGHGEPLDGAARAKVGRNDPCPCGSGKKYKKCHLLKEGG
jgi:preprotein translocase subunit SecA